MRYRKTSAGVTLIELMIAVAIIGILAAVAYPSYTEHKLRSNRSEAIRILEQMASLQEQYYLDRKQYAGSLELINYDANPYTTPSGNFEIEIVSTDGWQSYTLHAHALEGQKSDSKCPRISLSSTGERSATTESCWEK